MERQLGEAKKGLAEANRDGKATAAKIRALHAELEEVRFLLRRQVLSLVFRMKLVETGVEPGF